MSALSLNSTVQKNSCCEKLQAVITVVTSFINTTVIEGFRDKAKQDTAILKGASKTPWPNSKHNQKPSLAVDMLPYFTEGVHLRWQNKADLLKKLKSQDPETLELLNTILNLYHFAGIVKGVGMAQGTEIRWGGDWDGDLDFRDQDFDDVPHYEVKQK